MADVQPTKLGNLARCYVCIRLLWKLMRCEHQQGFNKTIKYIQSIDTGPT